MFEPHYGAFSALSGQHFTDGYVQQRASGDTLEHRYHQLVEGFSDVVQDHSNANSCDRSDREGQDLQDVRALVATAVRADFHAEAESDHVLVGTDGAEQEKNRWSSALDADGKAFQ